MIPTWQQRLDAMDHSKGTSNVMRQTAMQAEILELRAALREYRTNFQSALSQRTRTLTKAIKAHEKELAKRQVSLAALPVAREENRKLRKELARMSEATKEWKAQALKYQKLAAEKLHGAAAEREACARAVENMPQCAQYFPHVPEVIRARGRA